MGYYITAGQRFGRLIALSDGDKVRDKVEVRCECGVVKKVLAGSLYSGNTRSCGCFNREIIRAKAIERNSTMMISHGMSRTPEYLAWVAMKARCYNTNHPRYKDWGDRGIRVCDQWVNSFENFYRDMGPKPDGTSINRIDNDGNYEPSNCEWASVDVQMSNMRPAKSLTSFSCGHPHTPENTIKRDDSNAYRCRICRDDYMREYRRTYRKTA